MIYIYILHYIYVFFFGDCSVTRGCPMCYASLQLLSIIPSGMSIASYSYCRTPLQLLMSCNNSFIQLLQDAVTAANEL